MNTKTDRELLNAYTKAHSEAAFAELVRRHVHAVYSTALRIIVDPHLAEDVTQAAFVALARNAHALAGREVLSGWLHVTTRNVAAKTVRTQERRRSREQEASAMHSESSDQDDTWKSIAPLLDDALCQLNDADRDALLLRFFERQSASEIAQRLNLSAEAAQKRVTRAIERLRELLATRGCALSATILGSSLSVEAVRAAPAGLAANACGAAMAAAAASAGTGVSVLKLMLMTKLNTAVIGVAILVAALGIYKTRQASAWRTQVQFLEAQQASLSEQVQQLTRNQDENARRATALRKENERLSQNTGEVLRLRGELALLRRNVGATGTDKAAIALHQSDPFHNGKTWSQWLAEVNYGQPQATRDAAAKAIQEIGVQIVPRLLADMDPQQPTDDGATNDDRVRRATWAFAALGTNAAAVGPELLSRFESNPGYALTAYTSVLGRDAIPALTSALASLHEWVRWNAATALSGFDPGEVGQAIPALAARWNDPDDNVRSKMREALQKLDSITYKENLAKQ